MTALNERVRLYKRTTGKGPTGQPETTYTALPGIAWAEVKAISGRAFLAAGAELADVTMQVIMRYRGDLAQGDRVTHNGQWLEVVAPLPGRRANRLQLMCKTVPGGG
jgi:SPP1 family predicted phage head-tail adaptor